ncbi:hypothetical protein [Streptomyces galbus]|uniref:hypothetical protein n=1 Tax=Streptomyces gottesmaniae TaxID=3075518 RepID=UPI00052E56D3
MTATERAAPTRCAALSLALGARSAPLPTVLHAPAGHAEGRDALVVTGLRLPRTDIGLAVGAAVFALELTDPVAYAWSAFAFAYAFAGAAAAVVFAQAPARRAGAIDPAVAMKDVSPEEQKQVTSHPVWKDLPAVEDGEFFEVPDETWMSGIGVQAAEEMLADIAEATGVELPKQ